MKDELQGWCNVASLSGQCSWCKNKLVESHVMVACEYGKPWFPHAVKCAHHEPEDMDE